MKWFRLYNEIIHDPKIRSLAFEDRWHFVALMCLKNDGTLSTDSDIRDELVEVALGIHGVDLANLKKRLVRIQLINEDWNPKAWDKRQYQHDTSVDRTRKYRERLKKNNCDGHGDVTVTSTDTDTDTDTDKKNRQNRKRFVPPSLDEVTEHISEKGYNISAVEFWNHYEANGWMIGKAKVKSWKAAAAKWHARRFNDEGNRQPTWNNGNQRKLSGAERTRLAREERRRLEQAQGWPAG